MTIVGVLLAFGVLLGSVALSLDVGRILVEKRQLQNSADAAALALAENCWKNNNCNEAAVQGLVNANASDRVSGIQSACSKNMPGSTLPNNCGTASGALADCAPLPGYLAAYSNSLPYVEVRTKTQSGTASAPTNGMANWIAGLIGSPTSSAGACARAAVGAPSGGGEIPLTISVCEWERQTGGSYDPDTGAYSGGTYYHAPDYTAYPQGTSKYPKGYSDTGSAGTWPGWPTGAPPAPASNPGGEVVLLVQNPPGQATESQPCDFNDPTFGHQLPGGFSLLETTSNPCQIKEYANDWMHTDPGASTDCDLSKYVGKVIDIPIFECTSDVLPPNAPDLENDPCDTGNGTNAWYWRAGYASFYLSGYSLTTTAKPDNKVESINPNNTIKKKDNPCTNSQMCISGWFTTGSIKGTGGISGPPAANGYFGTYRVALVG